MSNTDAQTIIDDIRRLWELATPLLDIASGLHLPDSLIRHVLQHGTLPEDQPHWIQGDLLSGQPSPDAVSTR